MHVCAAPRVKLFASVATDGRTMRRGIISCHLRDCKALVVTHESTASKYPSTLYIYKPHSHKIYAT